MNHLFCFSLFPFLAGVWVGRAGYGNLFMRTRFYLFYFFLLLLHRPSPFHLISHVRLFVAFRRQVQGCADLYRLYLSIFFFLVLFFLLYILYHLSPICCVRVLKQMRPLNFVWLFSICWHPCIRYFTIISPTSFSSRFPLPTPVTIIFQTSISTSSLWSFIFLLWLFSLRRFQVELGWGVWEQRNVVYKGAQAPGSFPSFFPFIIVSVDNG